MNERMFQAFHHQNKDEVLLLLPQLHQPHLIRDGSFLNFSLLHYATQCGWTEVCRTLVEQYKCRADDTDCFQRSVLHIACQFGQVSVVKYLLSLESVSATVGNRDQFGHIPMERVTGSKFDIYSLFVSHIDLKMEISVDAFFKVFMAGK